MRRHWLDLIFLAPAYVLLFLIWQRSPADPRPRERYKPVRILISEADALRIEQHHGEIWDVIWTRAPWSKEGYDLRIDGMPGCRETMMYSPHYRAEDRAIDIYRHENVVCEAQ